MEEFDTAIARLPFSPSTDNGRGFLPPLLRAAGHFLYLLGRMSDTPTRRPTDNQITQEVESITLHLSEFTIPDYLSTGSKEQVTNFTDAYNILAENLVSWDNDTRIDYLKKLTNRLIQLTANLDRELLGLTNSDAGQSL